jgi:hypothetical protein
MSAVKHKTAPSTFVIVFIMIDNLLSPKVPVEPAELSDE